MYERLKTLISPPFIFCLLLLLLNDFYLKVAFHNMLTGKVSDVCGLFIFPIFWSAVFPQRKLWVFIFSGVLFIYWKSEFASGLIELVNTFFSVQRTVDPSDLIALPILLVAWIHVKGISVVAPKNALVTRLSTWFIGMVTIFSFCATSQQRSVQYFDQPQYILLKSSEIPDTTSYDEFGFYKMDSFLVVKVNYLYITNPVRGDDYNKNRSLINLDKDVMAMITGRTKLIPVGKITTLTINTTQGKDTLRFNGSRLDGRFTRTKKNKLIIEGFYKMGVEDSIWTFRDTTNNSLAQQTFIKGERTSLRQFDQGKLISSTRMNTRADTIRNVYIQIAVLILIVVGVILLLGRNYRRTFPEQLQLQTIWKWLLCFIAPIIIWLIHAGIRILLMDFNQDIFETLATVIFIFLTTCPLMFVVVFLIRLRKEMDILLYCLLFGLICSIWTTCSTLIALSN